MFPNKKDLFLIPAASIQLLEFHSGLFKELANFQVPDEYKPDIWFPRATFSIVKGDEQLCEGFAAARKYLGFPLKGSAHKLALLRISPDLRRACWSGNLSNEGGKDNHKGQISWQMRKCGSGGSCTIGKD